MEHLLRIGPYGLNLLFFGARLGAPGHRDSSPEHFGRYERGETGLSTNGARIEKWFTNSREAFLGFTQSLPRLHRNSHRCLEGTVTLRVGANLWVFHISFFKARSVGLVQTSGVLLRFLRCFDGWTFRWLSSRSLVPNRPSFCPATPRARMALCVCTFLRRPGHRLATIETKR